jgi:hypothetical protein
MDRTKSSDQSRSAGLCLIKPDSASFAPKSILTENVNVILGASMKRDMDLARAILIALNNDESTFDGGPLELDVPDCAPDVYSYHVMLLHDAGLIYAFDHSGDSYSNWLPAYLTWEGHEFLEAAKDDTRWNYATGYLKEHGGPMAFSFLKTLLTDYAKRKLFGPTSA